jgi:hypothetical protein
MVLHGPIDLLLSHTKHERERNVCIPNTDTTLCIQTDIMNYEISSQCKAIEKYISEQTYANVGFFLSDLLKAINFLYSWFLICTLKH